MPQGRPGLADADRSRAGAFADLLNRSAQDETALDALLFAYESLEGAERRALMTAIARDTARPAPALAALLTVEQSPALRSRLGSLLRKHGRPEWAAYAWGTSVHGGAALAQAVGGGNPEALLITWKHSEIEEIRLEAPSRMSFGEHARRVVPAVAVDAVVPKVWAHIRAGHTLPPGAERFAGFFSLP